MTRTIATGLLGLWLLTAAAVPAAALRPEELAVIVNTADPYSVEVGDYYARRRRIPPANIVPITLPAGKAEITRTEFETARAQMEARLPATVQALALAWTTPYGVECLSITTAFAFGFDPAFCAQGCRPTRPSPYFDSPSRAPWRELGLRPAMLLAGRSVGEAKAMIDRGIVADGTFPPGTAYLLSTSDRARNARAAGYAQVEAMRPRVRVERIAANELRDRSDVLFYFTGLASVSGLETLRFRPGAIADHLTSAGGVLTGDGQQMSALRWLEAGATGSYGTMIEPCNFRSKFPSPAIVVARYTGGETLLEAYWKSVAAPGQGVFVGEPLAAPFRARAP
jgi:uncharacterized protein (TIGR03790 family)